MYSAILAHGGTVMLHDISLGAAICHLARHFGSYAEFEDRMLAVEGPDAVRDFGIALAQSTGALGGRPFDEVFVRHRLLRWAVGGANRPLTHTRFLAEELRRHYPEVQPRVVRHGFSDRLPSVRYLPLPLWRYRLGVGTAGMIVGVLGIIARNKRVERSVAAFERLWERHPESLLVIAGSSYDRSYAEELRGQVRASRASTRIILVDYAASDTFHALIALCDVVISLRWPSLGGVSGILIRSLAAGKPTVVSDIPDWRDVGGEACVRVAPDDREVARIASHLLRTRCQLHGNVIALAERPVPGT